MPYVSLFFKSPTIWSLFCVCMLFACNTNRQAQAGEDKDEHILVLQYSRGPCFGMCPVFDVFIYSDGEALFKGRHFAPREGYYASHLDEPTMKKLNQQLNALKDARIEKQAKVDATDLPSYEIAIQQKSGLKRYKGNGEVPDQLGNIEDLVLELVDSQAWEPSEKEAFEGTQSEVLQDQIIVQLQSRTDISTLEKEYEKYRLSSLKRLSPNLPYWLITYDVTSIMPDEMLGILKKDPNVVDAEFNKKVEQRTRD